MNLKPLGDRVIVKQAKEAEDSDKKSGLILADTATEKPTRRVPSSPQARASSTRPGRSALRST